MVYLEVVDPCVRVPVILMCVCVSSVDFLCCFFCLHKYFSTELNCVLFIVSLYHTTFTHKVQDYYLHLRRKDTYGIVISLYRLLLVTIMLKHSKIAHRGTSHPYPKMILANLCILAHWKSTDFVGFRMLSSNISLFNEELGEMTFSLLARCVLGDTARTQIEHLNNLYKLLPIYRLIKDDIIGDVANSTSISWRHKVDPSGDEVNAVAHFFQQKISQLNRVHFTTYDGSPGCYKSRNAAAAHLVRDVTPTVYLPDVMQLVPAMFDSITASVHGNFLGEFSQLWPPRQGAENDPDASDHTDYQTEDDDHQEGGVVQWGADWDGCVVGEMAASRVVWQSGQTGICVHKVRYIDEDVIHSEGNIYHSFQGKEYKCTKDQWNISCIVSGCWYVLPGSSVADDTVHSYDVIVYFSKLLPGGKLPASAVASIRRENERAPLFSGN